MGSGHAPSSVASTDVGVPFTPGEESEKELGSLKVLSGRSESVSSVSVSAIQGDEVKRGSEGGQGEQQPKKKRRVAPTLVVDDA